MSAAGPMCPCAVDLPSGVSLNFGLLLEQPALTSISAAVAAAISSRIFDTSLRDLTFVPNRVLWEVSRSVGTFAGVDGIEKNGFALLQLQQSLLR